MAYSRQLNSWLYSDQPQTPVILVADDDPSIRLLLRHAMEKEGFSVIEAVNGIEAIQAVEKHQPALVLMDAVMPEMDGFTATSTLLEINEYRDLPVLIITSLDDDQSVARAFQSGAVDYISKPVNWSVLKHRVRRILHASETDRQVRHLAYHDSLTGLPNRLLFMDRLDQAITRAIRSRKLFALVYIDIDHFKIINESMGHDIGDDLLLKITDRLQDCIRQSDTIGRLGGDEFAIILENLQVPDDVTLVAKHVLSGLSQSVGINDIDVNISASIGISVYPDDGFTLGQMLKHAETAMYKAKEQGRNTFQFYTQEMSELAMRRLELENSLRNAIEKNELMLYYQPKYNLASSRCWGMEALVRWDHPEKGLISPDEFIPLAEETGLIVQLDEWVIRNACEQLSQWKQQGYVASNLSINVSARHFQEQTLTQLVQQVLEDTGLSAHEIEIELTESTLVNNHANARAVLNKLHNMGLRIALDDFGTGYASMAYLKDFPIDTVKIDRSFVWGIPEDKEDMAIVKAIVGLAESLDLALIAEGIETEEQINFLDSIGCIHGQGYYWSKPVSALHFEQEHLKSVTS